MSPRVAARGIPLGRWAGIPVRLSWTWFLIAGLVTLLFGPDLAAGGLGPVGFLVAAGYAVCLAASVLVHELAHAQIGLRHGHRADEIVLTLWGGHTQFRGAIEAPRAAVAVAVAGPVANLAVGGALALLLGVLDPAPVARLLLEMTAWANLLLGGFNLLPGLPLDGGHVVQAAVRARTGSRGRGLLAAGRAGQAVAVMLVVLVLGLPLALQRPLPSLWTLAVLGAVCWTLWQGAGAAVRHGRDELDAARLRLDAHIRPARTVAAHMSVETARALGQGADLVVLSEEGRPVGLVDRHALDRVPDRLAAQTPVGAASVALGADSLLVAESLSAAGPDLIDRLRATDTAQWVVFDHAGRVLGVLPRSAVPTPSRP